MNFFVKVVLIIFAAAYFISPIDLIPDFLIPYIGWLDDTFIIGIILYLIKYNKLPFSNFGQFFSSYKNQTFNKTRANQTSSKIYKDPYEILGINKNASADEINKAYKKKVKQYHPDKVSHLGEELQKIANEKFIEIKNAYDILSK